jgi:hypothetical protein
MPVARKRPCCVCHRWFRPDNRVGSRQRACSNPECQFLRRRRKQSAWRSGNPDYFCGRRIQARGASDKPPEPLRLPSPLNQLPWDIAQSEFGLQGADFIGVMGALLVHFAQSQLKPYLIDSKADAATLLDAAVQSQMPPGANWSCAGDVGHAAGIAPT